MAWIKRKFSSSVEGSEIWDGDGWQINKSAKDQEKPFVLIDANKPNWVPCSAVLGCFATLKDAQNEAERIGPSDWSDLPSDAEFYAQSGR